MKILVIAEKPSVARRLADALGEGRAERRGKGKISYFEIARGKDTLFVAAAVGHLYTIRQQKGDKARGYPVLNVEWAPSYEVSKFYAHTKEYLDTLLEIAQQCDMAINACDFDIEGTVIGTNVIKHAKIERAKRMKFSTTTDKDLLDSYNSLLPLDINNFKAGEVRHMLDWLWGINLSRALTKAAVGQDYRSALSIGRVQGPALALLAQKEIEISKFVPTPFWRLLATIDGVEFLNTKGDIFEKSEAEKAYRNTTANRGSAKVASVEAREQNSGPYPPFDLTSLQLEASRAMGMDPSVTLSVAQSLYEKSYISYPRTSSQKLPVSLGLPKIISDIAKNPVYTKLAKRLADGKRFQPSEGGKTDEAHPAIFPTGVMPTALNPYEDKLYDLITKRFLACFAEDAVISRVKVVVGIGEEQYAASGSRIVRKGWLEFYDYARQEEKILPEFKKDAHAKVTGNEMKELETQPPKRYTKAGLISELEKRDLGTKATRSQIIDTLFKRSYLEGTSITVTSFGMKVYETLNENAGMILDEQTTRRLEEDTEKISAGKLDEKEVLEEGKQMLLDALATFDKNIDKISVALRQGMREVQTIGKCPRDGGDMLIRRSRAGKQFAACGNYPKCTQTFSVPQNAKILGTGRVCEHCHTPIIKVIRAKRRPFEMDLDPNCITKKDWKKKEPEGEEVPVQKASEVQQPVAPKEPKTEKKPAKKAVRRRKAPAKKKAKKGKAMEEEGQPEAEAETSETGGE
jgi:DNA topoisomerase-1